MWSRTNQLIIKAAETLGIEWSPLSSEHTDFFLRLRRPDGGWVLISKTRSPFLTQVAQTLSNNKHVSRELLGHAGLLVVPDHLVDDDDLSPIEAWLEQPLAVKPNWGNRGLGVTAPVHGLDAVQQAVAWARSVDRDEEAVVEPYLEGVNLRVSVVAGRFVAAAIVERPVLVGDGHTTVRGLVERLNGDRRRGDWQLADVAALDVIEWDDKVGDALTAGGWGQDIVVPKDVEIPLHCEETETIDVTDELHVDWLAQAERACWCLGVDVGGVDFRGPRHVFSRPAPASFEGAGVLEVNVLPALHIHALPTQGASRPVFERFVAYCVGLEYPVDIGEWQPVVDL